MQKIQFFRGPFSKRKHGRILSAVCRADMLKFKAKKICFDEKVCLLLINFLYIMTRFQFVQFFRGCFTPRKKTTCKNTIFPRFFFKT